MTKFINTSSTNNPSEKISASVNDFLAKFSPLEIIKNEKVLLLFDEKSQSFYVPCHLKAIDIHKKADFEASIDDAEEDELYKLNRNVTENESAYTTMVEDSKAGRTFEDIVVEYDTSYNPSMPLKIYGGQHRIKAIDTAVDFQPEIYHGFRIYFGLSKEQKVEIATINNTSIAVSSDLLDRMKEQLLGNELRDFCQEVGLLKKNEDFSDKKDSAIPTVRIARTLVVNYWKGKKNSQETFHFPVVCKTGGLDEDYQTTRKSLNWKDKNFIEAGKRFALLHSTQRAKVMNRKTDTAGQFASKALSLTVVASWSYAAGYYSPNKVFQNILFGITDSLGANEDPLNAKALSEARLKGIDPDTYRGLGARTGESELGRMLEVFQVLVEKATEKKITKNLANAAIQSYEAKKATYNAQKSLSKI